MSYKLACRVCGPKGVDPNLGRRHHIEGDGSARRTVPEWYGTVPHIRGKQYQPSGRGLDGAANGILQCGVERRFPEFNPALLSVFHRIGYRDVIAGTDPALRMKMIDVEAAIAEP